MGYLWGLAGHDRQHREPTGSRAHFQPGGFSIQPRQILEMAGFFSNVKWPSACDGRDFSYSVQLLLQTVDDDHSFQKIGLRIIRKHYMMLHLWWAVLLMSFWRLFLLCMPLYLVEFSGSAYITCLAFDRSLKPRTRRNFGDSVALRVLCHVQQSNKIVSWHSTKVWPNYFR